MRALIIAAVASLALTAHAAAQPAAQAPATTRPPAPASAQPAVQLAAHPAAELRAQTQARLEKIAAGVDGVAGYCIIDLTSGERFERAAAQPFPTASTIKLAILYELMARADERTLSLDDTLALDRARAVPGGILYELGTPVLSLRDYANVMVIESDNTATNVLIARLGMDAITARMARAGLGATKLRRYMIDLEAAKRGDENVSTPADLARLLEMFHKGTGLTPARQEEALRILKKGKNTPIRRAVPPGIAIASKPGGLEGVRADTAIVYAKNRPFVFVGMTTMLQDEDAGDAAIEEMARAAYNYFSRLGAGSDLGRQLYR
jgi:beta-lactamase class A